MKLLFLSLFLIGCHGGLGEPCNRDYSCDFKSLECAYSYYHYICVPKRDLK